MSARVIGVLLAAVLAPLGAAQVLPGAAATEPAPPKTIPALQEWAPGTGSFTLGADPAIVVPSTDASALFSTAELLAQDLTELAGVTPTIEVGVAAQEGDIELARSTENSLGIEGYRLEVADTLKVSAPSVPGVFYGTRSVLQLLHQSPTVPAGTARDWPRYPERGVFVDLGRKYYSPAFFERLIQRMSYLKLNVLHLHLSDDNGLRVESTQHPEVVADPHLTKVEVADIVALAARHNISVIPEIDMPGHMTGILEDHPEFQLRNLLGTREPSKLDVTNPAARAFAKELIAEYLPLFPGSVWHIGADEYMLAVEYPLYPSLTQWAIRKYGLLANAKDTLHDFVNEMATYVEGHGRQARIWNDEAGDGSRVQLKPSIVVEWWTNVNPLSDPLAPSPQQLLADGHKVTNMGWWPCYFGSPGLPEPSMREAYDEWQVHRFYGPIYLNSTIQFPPAVIDPNEPRNLGSRLAIWGDGKVRTEDEVATDTLPHLRVMAQKTWESPEPATYDEFLGYGDAVGSGPGQG